MKVCVFGNSHCGALIRASSSVIKKFSNTTLDFFALTSLKIFEVSFNSVNFGLESEPSSLKLLKEMSKKDMIDTSYYDCYIVYLPLIEGDRTKFNNYNFPPSKLLYESLNCYFSDAEKKAAQKSFYNSLSIGPALSFAQKLSKSTKKKIYIAPTPQKSNIRAQKYSFDIKGSEYYAEGVKILKNYLGDLGFALIPQPENTIDGMFTKIEYTSGSKDLDGKRGHGGTDNMHMNDEYGELYLNHLLQQIKAF